MTYKSRPLFLLLCGFALTGCVGPTTHYVHEPYKLPSQVASATLKNFIELRGDKDLKINITTPLDSCERIKTERILRSGVIFSSDATEFGALVNVPAGMPFYIQYADTRKNGFCVVNVVVSLEAGRTYKLVGGPGYQKGPIPIFTGGAICSLQVLDEITSLPVPSLGKLCPEL